MDIIKLLLILILLTIILHGLASVSNREKNIKKAKTTIEPFLEKLKANNFKIEEVEFYDKREVEFYDKRIDFDTWLLLSFELPDKMEKAVIRFSRPVSSNPNIVCEFKAEIRIDKHIYIRIIPVARNKFCQEAIPDSQIEPILIDHFHNRLNKITRNSYCL